MTVVMRAECDACHCSGTEVVADGQAVQEVAEEAGMVDGSEFGLADVHPSCLEDLRRGIDPARDYGFGGLCSVDDLEPT